MITDATYVTIEDHGVHLIGSNYNACSQRYSLISVNSMPDTSDPSPTVGQFGRHHTT